MKHILKVFAIIFLVSCSPKVEVDKPIFGIVIHGGAGTILKENMSE